jgi:hypothetical protein
MGGGVFVFVPDQRILWNMVAAYPEPARDLMNLLAGPRQADQAGVHFGDELGEVGGIVVPDVDADEGGLNGVRLIAHHVERHADLLPDQRAGVVASGVAEEQHERLALEIGQPDRPAGMVGQAEIPAEAGGVGPAPRAIAYGVCG